ncbi:hypothetical protein KHQ06_26130 [Nocardia tengchongensis]|uniref:Uncharacterized protein n=1 Tax=Nocardia tengchongensis TaxID=2055889 RepID=A0ABX8CIJ7_9NOCA|nr:hypothetical protein [Nocardia tengchongensis]QVI19791.1 hypothetical protein KHQ06_26130 [Nocardia tengchongensis]
MAGGQGTMQGRPRENADDWTPGFGRPWDAMADVALNGADGSSISHTGAIAVTVAARADMLPMLRSVVETVLLTADFTLDVVTDVRVAIDEVATALVVAAEVGAEIACALRYDLRRVEVRISALTHTPDVLPENSLSRHLLESMVNQLSITYRTSEQLEAYRMVVRFGCDRTIHQGW